MRLIIIRRHLIYICLYILFNLLNAIGVGIILTNSVYNDKIQVTLQILEIISGIGLAIARISEPYVYINI